ncbi:hypothetical protein GC093_31175 [Paenibacillus sp. LMG 31456]|uniref:DUF6843 domain-containing protein n=1 Tax=Paenibacillus foliorum TaxID=2654974 RepID=A0A972K615_9BACL|nr:hypothetical protein [Paenibacillus foliorum]NOU97657.1 hypothetical protein [Paenibacillus foliorum]
MRPKKIIICLLLLPLFGCESQTNDIYLIPEGYEGRIKVTYNVEGAPALIKENNFDVIPVKDDGTFSTSNVNMEYGTVTDKYYLVDKEGKRKPVEKECISLLGTGSSQEGNGRIYPHVELEITQTRCSQDFMLWGK